MEQVKKALLITENRFLGRVYKALVEDIDEKIEIEIKEKWNGKYRVQADVIIMESKHFPELNVMYYDKAIIVLQQAESPVPYMKVGIYRFIFDQNNKWELVASLFQAKPVVLFANDVEYTKIIQNSKMTNFCCGEYDFMFDTEQFRYYGENIYLTLGEKRYLAEWLLLGHKDNTRRMFLCNLRKRFGDSFLKNVNRYGVYVEQGKQ